MPLLSFLRFASLFLFFFTFLITNAAAQDNHSSKSKELYQQIRAFQLNGGVADVKGLKLQRDRAYMTFDGTFYFMSATGGKVTGAVFIGQGRFSAAVPPIEFEKENVKRLLGAEGIDSGFNTAVLRFSDDTFLQLGKDRRDDPADPRAAKLAAETENRILKETGANLSARITLSLLNHETPGFFFASFDGGSRGRFSLLIDHQTRIPVTNFRLNAGEKGLIFKYRSVERDNEVWTAFASLTDFSRGTVSYSDLSDIIDVFHYDLHVDLRDHKDVLRLTSKVQAQTRFDNLNAVFFSIGEDLTEYENLRLQKQLRLKKASVDGVEVPFAQEDWEGGVTLFLPTTLSNGKQSVFEMTFEGDFMQDAQGFVDRYYPRYEDPGFINAYYPRSTTTWFPHHGYLDRATFDFTYRHPKSLKVASVGLRISEVPDPEDKNAFVAKYRMEQPIKMATFALAPFERHKQDVRFDKGGTGDPITIEFNSLSGSVRAIKEDFILAELDNSLRYFTLMFGKYPYPVFGATFHPYFFGQGFPSMLLIPNADRASKFTYSFIAHETAHQWWGNIVAWRSYRDQWLSEGFAQYSGILYTGIRDSPGSRDDLLERMRKTLTEHPRSEIGFAKERLVDVGPIILGHRLNSRKTRGAYQTLIYNKGALVLRMLHFLLTDPANGDDSAFFAMMTDFANRYRNQAASTDDFRVVASEHFARTPVGRMYKLNNLNWFFKQWVYESAMPSYKMEYTLADQQDGKVLLSGTVTQENAPESWFMVLPIVMKFGGKQEARGTVHAFGPKASFQIKLPARPARIELDPDHWVIAEKTSVKAVSGPNLP